MIADVIEDFSQANGVTYTLIRSLLIDGHEVAWMEYESTIVRGLLGMGREGQTRTGKRLNCECDFKPERQPTSRCRYKEAAMFLRTRELREEYDKRSNGLVQGGALGTFGDKDAPAKYTLDILGRHLAGEWVGGEGTLYLQTVADILNIPERAMWALVDAMEAANQLNRNQAVLFPYKPHPEYGGDPSSEYDAIEEAGYRIITFGPANQYERQEWLIRVFQGDMEVKTASAPLTHEPRFGYDVADVETLERTTQMLLDELKAAA